MTDLYKMQYVNRDTNEIETYEFPEGTGLPWALRTFQDEFENCKDETHVLMRNDKAIYNNVGLNTDKADAVISAYGRYMYEEAAERNYNYEASRSAFSDLVEAEKVFKD